MIACMAIFPADYAENTPYLHTYIYIHISVVHLTLDGVNGK